MIKLTKEQEEAIERLNSFKTINILYGNTFAMHLEQLEQLQNEIEIALNLIQEQQKDNEEKDKIIKSIKNYVKQEIKCYTENINDYIDDDKKANQNIINDLREDREHWKDIIKIINNQETYMNWKEYDENQAKV